MSSSDELTKRILSRLGLEVKEKEAENPKETKCPFDCSSKFSMLDKLGKDFYRLDSDLTTLRVKTEAQGQTMRELDSYHNDLWIDHQQVKEAVRVCGERLDEADKKLSMLDSKAVDFENRIGFLERESLQKKDIEFCEDCQRMMPANLFLKHKKEHGDSFIGFIVGLGLLLFGVWFLGRLLSSQNQLEKN